MAIETPGPVTADAAAEGATDTAAEVAGADVLERAAIASVTATTTAANRVWPRPGRDRT
jgi:hypothetical protein